MNRTNKLAMAGGAVAGGAATAVIQQKFGLTTLAAGGATAGVALAGSTVVQNPVVKDALYGASMGAGGLVGVQLLGQWYGRHHLAPAAAPKRQDDGDGAAFVTRDELNEQLGKLADRNDVNHKRTCDLMEALHGEIKRVVNETQTAPKTPQTWMPPRVPARDAVVVDEEPVEDEYMRNAYGLDDDDELRNARRERQQKRKQPLRVVRPTARPAPARPMMMDVETSGYDDGDSSDGSDDSESSDDGSDSTDDSSDSQGPTPEQLAQIQRSRSMV